MDYFTCRVEGSDDEVIKEESSNSLLYAQVREQLRFSEVHYSLFMPSKQTRGDQQFRDYAHDKQRKLSSHG